MKRIQEKVKDLIEVRSYKSLLDFISDPVQTLSIYHFTDITTDLMAKCLDKIASVQMGSGVASALAGYRGVGKSHFLATLGAIVSHPELRSRVTDAHVAASIQRLKRTRHSVAYVRRGTHETLFEELKVGIAKAFGMETTSLSNDLRILLSFAAHRNSDQPFVLIIDTAFERTSRVAREDGALLGKIAEVAKSLNMFVAVALDDDIAGADGINAAITHNFTIDYLDTEHLYRVVDANIFPKNRQMSPLLHDIYLNFKEVMPSFRWSEPRFKALYPLHPVILETAPFVRLYAPEFALLSFVAEAGDKIQGRPANSLIALDEVFDKVENSFRKIEDLNDAMATYDRLNSRITIHIPVMQRLQAKLVLKGLFLLSLEGNGTTAGEIAAAMLIYDENESARAIKAVESMLEIFVENEPDQIQKKLSGGGDVLYNLNIVSKEDINNELAEVVKDISPNFVPKVLRRIALERFADWSLPEDYENGDNLDCQIVWRGSVRRGRIIWNLDSAQRNTQIPPADSNFYDWEVVVGGSPESDSPATTVPRVFWKPAELRPDETETILRYFALFSNAELRDKFGEQISAVIHGNLMAVEKIWQRIFFLEGTLEIFGFDYNFTEVAHSAQNLPDVFTDMLSPMFETLYIEHPFFAETLEMKEVSQMANDFFSGARQNLPESQHLAETFAAPLGLVTKNNSGFVIESEENLITLPLAQKVLTLVKENNGNAVSLNQIYQQLKDVPYGLSHEAQHLILTALVAQRRIEFVTVKGDRINRRSLDLKIIWDDIEGIAKPSGVLYADQRLSEWAKILTASEESFSLDSAKDRPLVKAALEKWLTDWQSTRIIERFNDLPDEILNTKIWRQSTAVEKAFGAVAATVKAISDNALSLEEGLHRIADAFSDSEKEFYARRKDLNVVEDFINGAGKREKIWNYLAICETTDNEAIEFNRNKLLALIKESIANPSEQLNNDLDQSWREFHNEFSTYFASKHDSVMKSRNLQEQLRETFKSDEWWEFASLSQISIFQKSYWKESQRLERLVKEMNCQFEAAEMLKTQPFCACNFNLGQIHEWTNLPFALENIISRGRQSYRKILQMLAQTIISSVNRFAAENTEPEFAPAAANLLKIFQSSEEIPLLNNHELVILTKIFESLPTSPLISIKPPAEESFVSSEELRFQVNDWLDNLPSEPVLLKF